MAGEAEVQKHGAAFGKDYVLGFEIEMDDLLAMYRRKCLRDFAADPCHFVRRQWRAAGRFRQADTGDELHCDVRHFRQAAGRCKARHMRTRQAFEDHFLGLEAQNDGDVPAWVEKGNLQQKREIELRIFRAPE